MENKIKMIQEWIDAHKDEMVQEVIDLCKIPSVADNNAEIKPFGQPCIDVLEYMLKKGEAEGFATHNYENYVGHMTFDADRSIDETIGIWSHLDVVPVDDKWHTDPFDPVIKDGCVFGRGVGDNKDAAVGSFFIMKAIKELGIELNHNITLYMGTNEETGMHDLDYYVGEKNYPLPKFSLVPDAGWPGMRGQFGRIEFDLVSDKPVTTDIAEFNVGVATNVIPGEASITLKKSMGFDASKVPEEGYKVDETEETVKITAFGTGGHAGWPHGKLNALYALTKVVAENGCLPEDDQKVFDFITAVNADVTGTALGIKGEDEYGDTVCSGTMAYIVDGKLHVRHDSRYRVSGIFDEHVAAITENAAKAGMTPEVISYMNGSARASDAKEIKIVEAAYEEATGEKTELEVSRGGTYAGKLPRALAVGISLYGDDDFPAWVEEGYGWGHQPDELLPIEGFVKGVKLFAKILVEIDEAIK